MHRYVRGQSEIALNTGGRAGAVTATFARVKLLSLLCCSSLQKPAVPCLPSLSAQQRTSQQQPDKRSVAQETCMALRAGRRLLAVAQQARLLPTEPALARTTSRALREAGAWQVQQQASFASGPRYGVQDPANQSSNRRPPVNYGIR